MNDKEYKRLRNLITGAGLFIIFALVGLTFWFSYEIRDLHSLVANTSATVINGKDGLNGVDGQDGIGIAGKNGSNGVNGKDGSDGSTTVINNTTLIEKSVPTPGPTGPQGEPGAPAKQIQLSRDPDSGEVLWKYTTDDMWQVLEAAQ